MMSTKPAPARAAAALLSAAAVLLTALPCSAQPTPPTPTDLTATLQPGPRPEVELSWHSPAGNWFFRVYRSLNDTASWEFLAPAGSRQFHDGAVFPPNTYHYRVTGAVYGNQGIIESAPSTPAIVTLGPPATAHGTIRGSVVAKQGGQPIAHAHVRAFAMGSNPYNTAPIVTDPAGTFRAEIDTGTYLIKVEPQLPGQGEPAYLGQWYLNAPGPMTATPVHIGEHDTATLNFALASRRLGLPVDAAGVVTTGSGQPLAGATVAFLRPLQAEGNYPNDHDGHAERRTLPGIGYTEGIVWSGTTDAAGGYTAHIPDSLHYIAVAGKEGFIPQYADHRPDPTEADVFMIVSDTTGIDFSLDTIPPSPHTIQGVVQDSIGVRVPSRVILFPRPPGTHPGARFVHTDSVGTFSLPGILPGTYVAMAIPFGRYVPSYYRTGVFGETDWVLADTIVVSAGETVYDIGTVEIAARGLTMFSGILRSSDSALLSGGLVVARNQAGEIPGFGFSDGTGTYAVLSMESGPIVVTAGKYAYDDVQNTFTIPPDTYVIPGVNFALPFSFTTGIAVGPEVPVQLRLEQNYPNPFNPVTTITYTLPGAAGTRHAVSLQIFDLLGRPVATLVDGMETAGTKTVRFDASGLPSGAYFVRLSAQSSPADGPSTLVKRMLLLK